LDSAITGDALGKPAYELADLGGPTLIADILVALLITAVAIVLGVIVHPLLFFILVLAIVWLFARHGTHRGARL
jgi:hypothetical protein